VKVITTYLSGVLIIEPLVYTDSRGYFMETWSDKLFEDYGINFSFVQDNQSFTKMKGTIRGIHFQQNPFSQAKIVRVATGSVIDYAIDLRKGSPTFKKWFSIELSAENKLQLVIPRGFGHAFITLTDNVTFIYRCDNIYSKPHDRGIRYDDPSLYINWGTNEITVSEKDSKLPRLVESDCNYQYELND